MGLGDDMLKVGGIGEFAIGEMMQVLPVDDYVAGYLPIAEAGWSLSQHSMTVGENEAHVAAFERVNQVRSIAELRWSLEHVFEISPEHVDRLNAIGAGIRVQDQQYLLGGSFGSRGGPPFRTIVDSGIRVGAGTDASAVTPLSPWLSIYYMVTGVNVNGDLVNGEQQLSREEALRLYTTGSAWFTFDQDELGSIEPGKLADLVVLDKDYLSVSDEGLRKLRSLLTMVGGKVVYADEAFRE